MQFASSLPSLEPTPRPPASAFGLVTGVNNGEVASSWLQVPPTHMPWGNPAAHQPSIVRFTAEPLDKPGPSGLSASPFGQCKRKIDAEMAFVCRREPGMHGPVRLGARAVQGGRRGVHSQTLEPLRPPTKQLITEEKMAAHMRQLHISNSYTSHEESVIGTMASKSESSIVAPTIPAEEQAYKRLVLCEELRQLQSEPLLPQCLLTSVQRPSMALVLWQPPAGKVGDVLSRAAASREEVGEEERRRQQQQQVLSTHYPSASLDNNNTSGTIDLNTVHRFGQSSFGSAADAETMDL
ncbi:hypothetical protein R5R35_009905 [Gryllus longicercus]|uniref:Uncharacterized protein n=1 Tax=Gryllus longicercus TaxID=2509291 RepID=A0AAN9VV04_9ORTH